MTEQPPPAGEPLDDFAFNAIIGTWMEADVIADTVGNAFAQGAERVFLVDNGSTDDTVARACEAGAECALTYRTERFDEGYRLRLMNEAVRHHSTESGHKHVWWLWLDADEFPRPEGPGSIRDMLDKLDRHYRVVGARVLNHYPSPGAIAHIAGQHPAAQQPLCEEFSQHICHSMHRKHPLVRWDRHGPEIEVGAGFHRAESQIHPLLEPPTPIVEHHVPFRNEDATRARLDMLWSGSASSSRAVEGHITTDHMQARRESLDAVYAGEWSKVQNFIPGRPTKGVVLQDWRALRPAIHPELPTWRLSPDAGDS